MVNSEVAGEKKPGRQQRCIEVVITEYFGFSARSVKNDEIHKIKLQLKAISNWLTIC